MSDLVVSGAMRNVGTVPTQKPDKGVCVCSIGHKVKLFQISLPGNLLRDGQLSDSDTVRC